MSDVSSGPTPRRRTCSEDWLAWRDPEVPEFLSPTSYLLDRHVAAGLGGKAALIVDDVSYTYQELLGTVGRVAAGLRELRLARGSRLLMVGTDSVEFVVLWLACVRANVVPVVVSDAVKAAQLGYYLRDNEPSALYIDAAQLPKLASVAEATAVAPEVLFVRGESDVRIDAWPGIARLSFASFAAAERTVLAATPLHSADISYMLYSGSTTGPAKGVPHLAHDFLLIPERHGAFWEYTCGDLVHATSKKYFTHGLWPGVLIPLYWGATAVLASGPATGAAVVGLVRRHRPTKLITVPTTVKAILQYADETGEHLDFSSVGLLVTASEQVPAEIAVRFHKLFGIELMDSIGSSEITYEWIANRQRDHRRGTLGRPVFGYEVKLVSPSGDEVVEPGQEGEAWVRSRTSCPFYWRKLDATRATFIGAWTRTGDVLRTTPEGYYQYVGRRDDLFKVSGMWVSPLEVETAISAHPDVREVAVVGVTDAVSGLMTPKAFVVLRTDTDGGGEITEELMARVRVIGGFKVPGEIVYVGALPRTPLMKIDRKALREMSEVRA